MPVTPLALLVSQASGRADALLAGYAAASIEEFIAIGPRAGHPVRRLRTIILFRISTHRGWHEADLEGPDSVEDAGEVHPESHMNVR